MASFEIHTKKFDLFTRDAENQQNSEMTRIGAYFEASFHIIEACAAVHDIHINKHQMVRKILEESPIILGEDSKAVWSSFQELDNQIRPGQSYGGKINGENLKKAREIFELISLKCQKVISLVREEKTTKTPKNMFSGEKKHENANKL